jgi:hypothetical protein
MAFANANATQSQAGLRVGGIYRPDHPLDWPLFSGVHTAVQPAAQESFRNAPRVASRMIRIRIRFRFRGIRVGGYAPREGKAFSFTHQQPCREYSVREKRTPRDVRIGQSGPFRVRYLTRLQLKTSSCGSLRLAPAAAHLLGSRSPGPGNGGMTWMVDGPEPRRHILNAPFPVGQRFPYIFISVSPCCHDGVELSCPNVGGESSA